MIEVKYYAWQSSGNSKVDYKNGALFSGLVRDVPNELKKYLDETENRQYVTIFKSV